jgi:hypothetical protein
MRAADCMSLRPKGEKQGAAAATLTHLGDTFLLIHVGEKRQQELSLEEAIALLSERFELPAVSRDELSEKQAEALRKREARQAAMDREVAKQAAIDAARREWWGQQAELAAELGITWENWQRIAQLLSKPCSQLNPTTHIAH